MPAASINHRNVGIIGLGEVGQAIAEELTVAGNRLRVYDARPGGRTAAEAANKLGIGIYSQPTEFCNGLDVLVVAVPGPEVLPVAEKLITSLSPQTAYLDVSTKSIADRDRSVALATSCSIGYSDVTIVDPVAGPEVSVLASGPAARVTADLLASTRFRVRVLDEHRTVSTEVKLCRSILTKGLSALLLESLTAAYRLGIQDTVAQSFATTLSLPFGEILASLVGSAPHHATRRAREMDSVKEFVETVLVRTPMTTSASTLLTRVAREFDESDAVLPWADVIRRLDASSIFR